MSFVAQYPGLCVQCDVEINPGDQVESVADYPDDFAGYRHVVCPDESNITPGQEPCPGCNLMHAGECF